MTRQLRKTIMHCSRLKNIFKKNCTAKTWDSCKIQCNFYVNQKTKKTILKISMLTIQIIKKVLEVSKAIL